MKKIALAALTGVILTSCTIERTVIQEATTTAPATTQPEITATPTTLPPTTPAPVTTDEKLYIRELHQASPDTRDLPEDELIETGWAVCGAIANGSTLDDLADMIIASASDDRGQKMLQYVTVYAVLYLCPQYDYIMDDGY